jgi:AraC-like DNA-binding protein
MNTDHMDFAKSESDALKTTAWELWVKAVEKNLGHSLDGDQQEDGYSLGFAYDAWKSGSKASEYALQVRLEKARRLLAGTGWGVFERDTVMQAADKLDTYGDALSRIARTYNQASAGPGDIVNTAARALLDAGYELIY